MTDAPTGAVIGRGTEAVTLEEADIENAVGIVAGTDDDTNNLSIIMTARELNPDLFMVARQNSSNNEAIFQAADVQLIMRRGSIIAHTIFALIRTPLLGVFLEMAYENDNQWANHLVSRISGLIGEEAPVIWDLMLNENEAPGMIIPVRDTSRITVRDVYRDPRDRDSYLPCIPLLHQCADVYTLLPEDDTEVVEGDRLLFCGLPHARSMMDWLVNNSNVFSYVVTGKEHASSSLGRLLAR